MADRYNVESFNLDHTRVAAPYVRVADVKELNGVTITKFDLRFTQPNERFIPTDALHSLEHLLAENSRNHSDEVLDLSPMGCRTGFYLIMHGKKRTEEAARLMIRTLQDVLKADRVPGCSPVHCGNYRDHDLEGAKLWARRFLSVRESDLLKVFREDYTAEERETLPDWPRRSDV
ncbi:S-ribosylhomocysteine lyase /quorum-sensing autoinducer 2 (AI-2) synthesis protein LuxS [Melghirimyces profundicolus]|uniref:S-ribosylhomocysteine lyase n=1 Tax=Melghirimyces profundicolus TaxID=1242148 RepID=A0A2T6B2P7_9BACL|nr:S-ribosylhomocysteine lyase [Melghirimyces profundicolus]PTX50349.1 S-ribosylhomocysteine lyase /quorum-sensing autoinducer 2 (AI-2) synthesis protein LuxS [Melghirimyces profundicolus]